MGEHMYAHPPTKPWACLGRPPGHKSLSVWSGREWGKTMTCHLQTEGRVTLLEHQVPDVQGPVHLGGEENRWSHRAPGSIGEVSHVVPVGASVVSQGRCGGEGWSLRLTPLLTEVLLGSGVSGSFWVGSFSLGSDF